MAEFKMLPEEVELNATMEELTTFAAACGVKIEKGWDEKSLASKLIHYTDSLSDADWEALDPAVQTWTINIGEQVQEIKKQQASASPALPAAKPAAKTPKSTPDVASSTFEQMINSCSKKADIIATAQAAAKTAGKELKLMKSWSVGKLKEEAIKQLTAEPASEPESEAVTPMPSKPTAKRVSANASAPDPASTAVANAKARAKANAKEAKTAAASGTRGKEEGEPFRRNTTAWLVWDVLRKSKKALKIDEVKERFMKSFASSGLKSSNPESRVPRVLQCMISEISVAQRNEDGTYQLK